MSASTLRVRVGGCGDAQPGAARRTTPTRDDFALGGPQERSRHSTGAATTSRSASGQSPVLTVGRESDRGLTFQTLISGDVIWTCRIRQVAGCADPGMRSSQIFPAVDCLARGAPGCQKFSPTPKSSNLDSIQDEKTTFFLFWIESRFDNFEVVKYDLKAEKRRFFVLD